MRAYILLFLVLIHLKANLVFAANTCINDPQETRNVGKNQSINNAVLSAQDPLSKDFNAWLKKASCPTGNIANKTAKDIEKVISFTLPSGGIKAECIQASLQREVGKTGYTCKNGQPSAFENYGETAPCINQQTFDFVRYSVNQAIKCMSPPEDPIDPRVILKKINNETGFNFYIGYSGGTGIGQLTSAPVHEIAGWWEPRETRNPKAKKNQKTKAIHVRGNAYSILETLNANPNPACAPFKKIIAKDLTSPPPSPGFKKNYCSWLSVGEGLGRSLVYGLGYYVYARDHFIKKTLEDRAPALLKNKDLVSTLTLVAYGPGGPAQAKALIRSLRLNNRSNPQAAIKKIAQKSDYVSQTNEKMNELLANMNKTSPTPKDLQGDTCVAPY